MTIVPASLETTFDCSPPVEGKQHQWNPLRLVTFATASATRLTWHSRAYLTILGILLLVLVSLVGLWLHNLYERRNELLR